MLIRLKDLLRELWLTFVYLCHLVKQEIVQFIVGYDPPWDFYEEGEYGEQ